MLKSSLCNYSGAYIFVKERTTITGVGDAASARQTGERNKGVAFKNRATSFNFKAEINNTEIDNAKYVDIVIPMYDLIEYSDNYSKISGSLW